MVTPFSTCWLSCISWLVVRLSISEVIGLEDAEGAEGPDSDVSEGFVDPDASDDDDSGDERPLRPPRLEMMAREATATPGESPPRRRNAQRRAASQALKNVSSWMKEDTTQLKRKKWGYGVH